jgi:FAD/FMN-containing dehydrogenase
VIAKSTDDVVAAINFARRNNLRLVVKGGGHSYQGTSDAADSLLIWTRRMNAVTLHDAFIVVALEVFQRPTEWLPQACWRPRLSPPTAQ